MIGWLPSTQAILALGHGVPLFHAGDEVLRRLRRTSRLAGTSRRRWDDHATSRSSHEAT